MNFKKQTTQKKLNEIKATANTMANKVYGERPKPLFTKKIPFYLTEELHEEVLRYTMEQKISGGKDNNISALLRRLLIEFLEENKKI